MRPKKPVLLLYLLVSFCLISDAALAEWVPRPDAMFIHRLMDSDQLGDVTRVLYQTMPNLEQHKLPNAAVNVYVAELHPDGRIENRALQTGKRHFSALLLQRGHDAVLAVVTPAHGETVARAEVWSATDGTLLSAFESAELKRVTTNMQIFPTDDGNFFYVLASLQPGRGNQPNTLTWKKINPQGDLLVQGQWALPNVISGSTGAFPVSGGGLGMVIGYRLVSEEQVLDTDIEAVQTYDIAGRTIEARVFSEKRLLATDSNGERKWLSPAIERDLIWMGDMTIPQTLPPDEMMAQSHEQMALMERVTLENDGERRITGEARFTFDEVQRTSAGYGMLVQVSADRKLSPPQNGMWFIEIGEDGSLLREQRIEAAAEQLKGKFDRYRPTADGGLLVAGTRREGGHSLHLTALNKDGAIEWTSRLDMENAKIHGIGGSKAKPWVYGENYNESETRNQMWAELVAPSSMNSVDAPPPAQASQPQAAPNNNAAPTFEMPEPAEGCECSCEEFSAFRDLTERMKSASQSEMMAMIQDPAYTKATNCAAGCAMAYMNCR